MSFNTRDARAIADKLGATIVRRTNHDIAQFWHDGIFIGSFGIRRGSKPNLSHDYIPEGLHISPNLCKKFQVCIVGLEELVAELRRRSIIPPAPP